MHFCKDQRVLDVASIHAWRTSGVGEILSHAIESNNERNDDPNQPQSCNHNEFSKLVSASAQLRNRSEPSFCQQLDNMSKHHPSDDSLVRKQLSFQIRKLHRREVRQWKSSRVGSALQNPTTWKLLRSLSGRTSACNRAIQPPVEDFACMLESLFSGHAIPPVEPLEKTEPKWTRVELDHAINSLKMNKSSDEFGLVAELMKYAPDELLQQLLRLFNHVLETGSCPTTWHKTLFKMIAKKAKAIVLGDFRPIANVRLLYKTFCYMMLGRLEHLLEAGQPEEQHGFRAHRRIEEHLLTANLLIDKTLASGIPIWIISLDLSKAFDRVDWQALWKALQNHGVSGHLIWLLQCLYHEQWGEVHGDSDRSRAFKIRAGVR